MDLPEIKLGRIRKTISLVYPKGAWFCQVISFQYDMTSLALSRKDARKEFIKEALDFYNSSDTAKAEYIKWLLEIRQ